MFGGVGVLSPHRIQLITAAKRLQTQLVYSRHSNNIHLEKSDISVVEIKKNLTLGIKGVFLRPSASHTTAEGREEAERKTRRRESEEIMARWTGKLRELEKVD